MTAPQLSASNANTEFYQERLPNGLQIVGQRMPDLESVSVCFFARTGARDERDPAIYGVSHFLEHMVFKGTASRDAEQITLDFNRMGAEFNAYTSVEQTVFYARVLGQYLPTAVDLLSDMMRPRLDGGDFALERNVILEEIARSEDVPSSQAYRRMMQTYFAGHPLGHDVLGTKESIGNLKVEQMRDYHARRYSANNLVFAIAGNFDWRHTLDLIQRACGDWTSGEEGRQADPFTPTAGREIITKDKLKQQIMLLAWPTVSVQDDDDAMELAAMVLGDGSGSRMFWNIFQKGLAETAAASLSPLDRTGLMLAYLSTTPEQAPEVLDLTLAELKSLQQDGAHEDELRRAKDKLVSRTVLDGESGFSRMQDLAYNWVAKGELRSLEDEVARIEAVTLEDVRRALDRFPVTAPHVFTAYGPLEASAFDAPKN
jgi:predicted Zn-dependent peptidase